MPRKPQDPAATVAALYLRVSSRTQDTASQEPEMARWADAHDGPTEVYRDTATGKNLDRPGWRRLWADILAGKVTTLVVWRLDRLGRTAGEMAPLFDDLRARGINLVSLREGFDLATPAGRMLANVLASFAQFETEVRSERQLAGIDAAKAKGVQFGRPKGSGKPIKVTPEQRDQVRRLRAEGQGVSAIARATGLSRPTVYALLEPAAADA